MQHHHFESTKNGTTCKHLALEGIVSRRSGLALGAFFPSVSSFRTLANGSSCSPILNHELDTTNTQGRSISIQQYAHTALFNIHSFFICIFLAVICFVFVLLNVFKSLETYLALLIITVLGIKKWNFLRSPLQRFEIHLFNHPLSILRCGRIPLFFFHCLPF